MGWMLLESVLACALLALMSVAAYHTVKEMQEKGDAVGKKLFLPRAQSVLAGQIREGPFHLPPPDESAVSVSRPGYVEGWLPNAALGLPLKHRVRYLVHAALIAPLVAIYQPDPLQLAGGHVAIRAATQANGLDFCMLLMKAEVAGTALPGGMRIAFALQEVLSPGRPDNMDNQLWLTDGVQGPPPVGVEFSTLTAGFGEFSEMLGCREKFSRLAVGTKAAAVQDDLVQLAVQQEHYRAHGLAVAQQLSNVAGWKSANTSLFVARFAADMAIAQAQMDISPVLSLPNFIASQIALIANLSATAVNLQKMKTDEVKAATALTTAQRAVELATTYRKELEALLDATAAQTNRDQLRGLNP